MGRRTDKTWIIQPTTYRTDFQRLNMDPENEKQIIYL